METIENEKKWSLPKILRFFGGSALLVSGIIFLMQGLQDNDTTKKIIYFMFFNFSVYLTGLICALAIKEPKGARVSLASGLSLLPLYFLQIGAVLFATFNDPTGINYPQMLKFDSLSYATIGLLGFSLFAFSGLVWFAFKCLANKHCKYLTFAYIFNNALLLLPIRGVIFSIILGSAMMGLIVFLAIKYFQKENSLNTFEINFAKGILFLPFFLLMLRTISLYNVDCLLFSYLALTTGLVLSVLVKPFSENKERFISKNSFCYSLAWFLFVVYLTDILPSLNFTYYLLMFAPIGVYHFYLGLVIPNYTKRHNDIALVVFCIAVIMNVFVPATITNSIISIIIGMGLCGFGLNTRSFSALKVGIILLTVSLIRHYELAIRLYEMSPWLSIGIMGIAIIILSSYIERNYTYLVNKFNLLRSEFK